MVQISLYVFLHYKVNLFILLQRAERFQRCKILRIIPVFEEFLLKKQVCCCFLVVTSLVKWYNFTNYHLSTFIRLVEIYRGQIDKSRIYVDPGSYSQIDHAVYNFTTELKATDLEVGKLIGEGEFADVHIGVLSVNNKKVEVAVKKLRVGLFTLCLLNVCSHFVWDLDGENIWQSSRLEIKLDIFLRSTILQKQIILIIYTLGFHTNKKAFLKKVQTYFSAIHSSVQLYVSELTIS